MKRIAVFIIVLTVPVWAVAQTTLVTQPGGLSTNTGTAVIVAPPSTPLVVTPEFHLSTVAPQLGASNATAGNTAGATNSTAAIPAPSRIITTVPQFSTAGAVTETVLPQQGAAPGGTASAGGPVVVMNNAPLFDRGVGATGTLVAGGDTGGRSLGEIARENRQREAGANAHVYTNQDIQRINQQPQTQIGGMTGAAVGAGNATQAQPSSNMPMVSQPTIANPPANPPGVSQPVPPSNTPPPDQSQANPPSPMASETREMAQANPPANPAAQDQQTPSPSAERNQLPRSGSILPLMALVGVLAAGAGLLAK